MTNQIEQEIEKMRRSRDVSGLIEFIEKQPPSVGSHYSMVLGQGSVELVHGEVDQNYPPVVVAQRALMSIAPQVIDKLSQYLHSPSWVGRILAVRALASTKKPEVYLELSKALQYHIQNDPPGANEVGGAIIRAMGETKSDEARKLLMSALEDDKHPWIRVEAAGELSYWKDKQVIEKLVQHLGDHGMYDRAFAISVGEIAAGSLAQIGGENVLQSLIQYCEQYKSDEKSGIYNALLALRKLGDKRAAPLLKSIVRDATIHQNIRKVAKYDLEELRGITSIKRLFQRSQRILHIIRMQLDIWAHDWFGIKLFKVKNSVLIVTLFLILIFIFSLVAFVS